MKPVLLTVALLLAGCAGAPGADVVPADDANATPDALPPVQDRVDDGARSDLGHMPHMHDYWKGRERVTLHDDPVDPSSPDPIATLATAWFRKEAKVGGAQVFLPEGALVFEGTGAMEVTASWSDPRVTGISVAYRTPASKTWTAPVELPNGKPLVLEVTPDMTDMPHAKMSRWAFWFEPSGAAGAALAPFDLKVDILKMRDIALFPAHPELFEGAPQKVLHDDAHAYDQVSYAKRVPVLLTTGNFDEREVTLASLVPMETQWMRVEVEVTEATATPGQVADIRFFYAAADRSQIGHPYLHPVDGSLAQKRLVYEFPVTMEQTDTPYGNESQWRFFVEPTTQFVGHEAEPDCGGCTDVHIAYRLKVTAFDHVPEGAEPSKTSAEDEA